MRIIISILILLGFYSCDNKTSDYYYNLACDEEQKGNLPAAINYLDKALEINPKDIGALNNRGYDYLELKKYDLAKSSFQKMVDLDNNCPGAYYGLGYLNYKLQNYENAISYFDTVIKIKGGGPLFLEHVDNPYTKSPFSMDVSIEKVYKYKNLSEQMLKEANKNK
jgi:tetratricopeptide (TPR) repeat protein